MVAMYDQTANADLSVTPHHSLQTCDGWIPVEAFDPSTMHEDELSSFLVTLHNPEFPSATMVSEAWYGEEIIDGFEPAGPQITGAWRASEFRDWRVIAFRPMPEPAKFEELCSLVTRARERGLNWPG